MIFVKCEVPKNLAGGSLLDAHKWVKAQMAKQNPRGSADYTLRSMDGHNLTLSDLIRSNPCNEIEIVTGGESDARSNPNGIVIPTNFSHSPSFPRVANFSSDLLPSRLDPQLVERMVAQEGLFGAVQTLTILLSQRSVTESISPTVAGLLYAHSAIPRQNPSVKTPFLGEAAKQMYDSDIRIRQYLDQQFGQDIEAQDSIIGKASISAKYGLTKRDLDRFVADVLAPFLAIAPANRAAFRTINKRMPDIRSDEELRDELPRKSSDPSWFNRESDFKNAYAKLMELMPTKAEDFYHGREYGLIANPKCIYPILAHRILTPEVIIQLLHVAHSYPDNLRAINMGNRRVLGLRLSRSQARIIRHRTVTPVWRRWFRRVLMPTMANIDDSFRAKLVLASGEKPDDESYIENIVEAIQAPGLVDRIDPESNYFIFAQGIGGFFPSPPKKWPAQVVYSVMDAFLMALPDIVDIDNPSNNYHSNVYMSAAQPEISDSDEFILNKKGNKITLAEIQDQGADPDERAKTVDKMDDITPEAKERLKANGAAFVTHMINNHVNNTFLVDAKAGKSIFELLFEVMEIATSKYNYEMADSDITFALMLIDFSIRELFDDGHLSPATA